MRFTIIEDRNNSWKHISWIGTYTYGSSHCRGISINIFSKYGNISDRSLNESRENEPSKNHEFSEESYQFRHDSYNVRLEGFNLKDNFNKSFVNCENVDLDDFFLFYTEEEIEEYLAKYKYNFIDPNNDCLLSLNIPLEDFLNEIEEIRKIAKENNVTEIWV